ncbi:aldehyde dehydrogenase family protein [Georgenia subflava]|uniref:Aldehyde dehydrogenase family protein n=1 Tax=Georgenia subflava TaxID=1622177 RepID=A0A6N7EEB7_9MICO|nr:aldehyde dehydrogenase family protein [Georgenia subflava]MPV35543.1 aldehyde dehydrogenase family protein [Georgenia subflava]
MEHSLSSSTVAEPRPTVEKPQSVTAQQVGRAFAEIGTREPALLVGGDWVAPRSTVTRASTDPSTGRVWASYAVAGAEDVDAAVVAAAEAQRAWARTSVMERAACLDALRRLVDEHATELAIADAIDAGLPVQRMFGDVAGATNAIRGWSGLALSLRGEVLPDDRVLHYTRTAPYGVVAKIVAYNHPLLFAVKGSLAALIAGNAVVLKPAEQTPMSAVLLGDLVRQAFPPGVFSIVTGDGATGDALVTHPLVRRIAFTGSVATGRLIQQRAASNAVRSVSLELGGKNPMIVCDDVDLDRAAQEVVKAMNLRANQGQSCGSTSRLFVHTSIHDELLERVADRFAALRLGPAYDPEVDMGPLISAQHAQRVRGFIGDAESAGARLVTGGLDDARVPEDGYFVAPTLFADVAPGSPLARDEVFGPLVAAFRWENEEALLEQVNAVDYGLTASIWTDDVNRALRLADEVEAGYVWVNDSTTHYWGTPFGGWKDSGVGREESIDELRSYLQTKSVHIKFRA